MPLQHSGQPTLTIIVTRMQIFLVSFQKIFCGTTLAKCKSLPKNAIRHSTSIKEVTCMQRGHRHWASSQGTLVLLKGSWKSAIAFNFTESYIQPFGYLAQFLPLKKKSAPPSQQLQDMNKACWEGKDQQVENPGMRMQWQIFSIHSKLIQRDTYRSVFPNGSCALEEQVLHYFLPLPFVLVLLNVCFCNLAWLFSLVYMHSSWNLHYLKCLRWKH